MCLALTRTAEIGLLQTRLFAAIVTEDLLEVAQKIKIRDSNFSSAA